MVNHNSTTFVISEKVDFLVDRCLRKIIVVSEIGLLATYTIKKTQEESSISLLFDIENKVLNKAP